MNGGTVPLKVFWALLGAVVVAVGTAAFVVGAFVVNLRETARVEVPATGGVYAPQEAQLPKADGPPPADEDRARDEVTDAFEQAYAGANSGDERLSHIDDSEGLEELRQQVLVHFPLTPLDELTVRVEQVRFLNRKTAAVRYAIVLPGYSIPEFPNRIGRAVLVDGTWKDTRQTLCNDLTLGSVTCPR